MRLRAKGKAVMDDLSWGNGDGRGRGPRMKRCLAALAVWPACLPGVAGCGCGRGSVCLCACVCVGVCAGMPSRV